MRKLSLVPIIALIAILGGCSLINNEDKNLVGYWSFNEGEGNQVENEVTESKQHINYVFNEENQQMLFKEASDPLWKETGIVDGSLLFDGYSTYIEDEEFKHPEEQMTISLWVAPRVFEWGDNGYLSAFVSQGKQEAKRGIVFGMYRHGTWGLQLGLGDSLTKEWKSVWADEENSLPKYEWSHVVATYDSETAEAKLYLNGNLVGAETFEDHVGDPINVSEEKFTIGKYNYNTRLVGVFDLNVFNGMMDELKVYNESMDAESISNMYDEYLEKNDDKHPELDYETIMIDSTKYEGDRYRPQFHAIPPGHWMNEPHAPIYYNGKYHLFYQQNPAGPFWHQIHWGHWVSDDMVNWENVKEAVSPMPGNLAPDGIWTGSATYDESGDPVLFITAGNDAASPNQAVGICRPVDLSDPYLEDWECEDEPTITQKPGQGDFGEFRDPFVWKEGDTWYLINGSGTNNNNGGTALAYSSKDLENWTYHGNFYETDYDQYKFMGEHWELPVMLPIQTEDGTEEKYIFIVSPHGAGADIEVYYWIGEFDKNNVRFVPDHEEPKLIDYGDGFFTGPSGFVDPKTGRTIIFTIAQGKGRNSWEDYYSGWAHTAGMPMSIYLDNETKELRLEPIEEIKHAHKKELVHIENKSLSEANELLNNTRGDLLDITLEIESNGATEYGIKVRKDSLGAEFTSIFYDEETSQVNLNRLSSSIEKTGLGVQRADLELENGVLKLRLLLDRSLLEVYANNEVSFTTRIFPTLEDSMGIELFADGDILVKNMQVYEMGSVYTEDVTPPYYGNTN